MRYFSKCWILLRYSRRIGKPRSGLSVAFEESGLGATGEAKRKRRVAAKEELRDSLLTRINNKCIIMQLSSALSCASCPLFAFLRFEFLYPWENLAKSHKKCSSLSECFQFWKVNSKALNAHTIINLVPLNKLKKGSFLSLNKTFC